MMTIFGKFCVFRCRECPLCDVLFFDTLNDAIRREIESDGKTIDEKVRS